MTTPTEAYIDGIIDYLQRLQAYLTAELGSAIPGTPPVLEGGAFTANPQASVPGRPAATAGTGVGSGLAATGAASANARPGGGGSDGAGNGGKPQDSRRPLDDTTSLAAEVPLIAAVAQTVAPNDPGLSAVRRDEPTPLPQASTSLYRPVVDVGATRPSVRAPVVSGPTVPASSGSLYSRPKRPVFPPETTTDTAPLPVPWPGPEYPTPSLPVQSGPWMSPQVSVEPLDLQHPASIGFGVDDPQEPRMNALADVRFSVPEPERSTVLSEPTAALVGLAPGTRGGHLLFPGRGRTEGDGPADDGPARAPWLTRRTAP